MNARLAKAKKSEVLIVGAGPLGWGCARLLAGKGINTLLVDPRVSDSTPNWRNRGLGVFWPSLNDPPTRAVVAHGHEMAAWLQNFCRLGAESAAHFLPRAALQRIRCLRVGIEAHEVRELNQACALNLGLSAGVRLAGAQVYEESYPAYFIGQHDTREHSENRRMKELSFYNERVIAISEEKDGCKVFLGNNQMRECEIVILANGYQMAGLIPWVKDMLVPMSDVHTDWSSNLVCEVHSEPLAVRTASGHVAAVFLPQVNSDASGGTWTVRLTGPRFLLPSAGAGVDLTGLSVDDSLAGKIEQWLRISFLPVMCEILRTSPPAEGTKLALQRAQFGVDCLPCDELPILGELGSQGRILASTGWLGCGWSASLRSATVLCELIENGFSPHLDALLKPTRWRSGGAESGVTGMT